MAANIILIALVGLVFFLCLRKVLRDMKHGGGCEGCSGCGGHCTSCGAHCPSHAAAGKVKK